MTGVIGAFLTAVGAFVKVFSVGRDRFYVVLIGQMITAISQLFILSVPATIAVTWFKSQEVRLFYIFVVTEHINNYKMFL